MGTYEGYDAELLSKSINLSEPVPGETITISFELRNISAPDLDHVWRLYSTHKLWDMHYLLSKNDFTTNYVSNRVDLTRYIFPYGYNEDYVTDITFTLSFVTPTVLGRQKIQFQLYTLLWNTSNGSNVGKSLPFGPVIEFEINILPHPAAQLISNTFPSQMEVAERGTALITFKNTGIWTWDYNFRFEAINTDATYFSKSWYYIPIETQIAPGSSYTFQIPLRANCSPGTYNPSYRLLWNRTQTNFGDTVSKTVKVITVSKPIQNLDDYDWKCLTARRSTSDIAWSYDIEISGTDVPETFQKLHHEIDGYPAMIGYPTEYEISVDTPAVSSNVGAFSAGWFLSNKIPIKNNSGLFIRQSRGGSDIKSWQMGDSNVSAIQGRTEEIKTYENPSHYLARVLFYVNDSTGAINTNKAGPYGLWPGTIKPVPNWGISRYTGSDGNQYADGDTIPPGVILTPNAKWDNKHPTTEDPYMIEKKQFSNDGKSIIDILDDLADHCHMLYFTRFVKVGTEWREYFYWIPKYGVALGWLGVSQTVTQINPNTHNLMGSPGLSASIVLEDNFNCVWVEACRKKDSAWFYGFKGGAGVTQGTEIARPLYFRSHDLLPDPVGNNWVGSISTSSNFGPGGVNYGTAAENARCQQIVDKKAQQLVDLLDYEVPTFTATFLDESFELYQVVRFTGFEGLTQFNGIDMQIIGLEYQYNPPDSGGHSVTITCAPKAMLQASGKFQSMIDEIQENYDNLVQGIESSNVDDKLSIIISTYDEGSMCNAQLRSTGSMFKTRTYGYRTESG